VAVSIVAWVSIAFGLFFFLAYGLAGYLFLANPAPQPAEAINPTSFLGWSMPAAAYWSLVLAVPLVLLIDGVFLLKGHNWARMLAVIWWAFCLLSLIYTYGLNLITGIQAAICLALIFFLNTSRATMFFRAEN
jgi:hypothetical protein